VKYDLTKVREACLELMGWKRMSPHDLIWWTSPDGSENGSTGDYSFHKQAPNPTTSLGDALPLIEKYGMAVAPPNVADALWLAQVIQGYPNVGRLAKADSPCLAVCLCALRCEDRNLEDFKVSP
jgi:hypothetical protein